MGDEDFDSVKFEHHLSSLRNSQQTIQSMSNWCMQRRAHHKKIVASWLVVLKQVKVDQRLTLFYLANDVIQNSKRKNYEFVGSWGTALQRATTMVRDDKVKQKIARIFKIWEERSIYNEDFLADLNGLLNTVTAAKRLSDDHLQAAAAGGKSSSSSRDAPKEAAAAAAAQSDLDDFQCSQLVGHINACVRLQEKTDKAFKLLPKSTDVDVETIKQTGKDREHVEGVQAEVNDSVSKLEHYIHSLRAEIKVRNIVIAALGQADEFYRSQRGDVKTVAIAYRNFGLRIKTMKKKLDELTTTLPSPMPSPDINAPSPPPDADLELPGETSFSSFLNGSTTSSFLGSSQLPFDISDFHSDGPSSASSAIQVISSRDDESNNGGGGGGYKPVMPPQPVPPVGGAGNNMYGGHQMFSSTSTSHSQSGGGGGGYNPTASSYGSNTGGGGGYSAAPPPLVPPPMPPPMLNNNSDEYTPSSSWNPHTESWTGGVGIGGVPPPINVPLNNKAPASPPFFERKGNNAAPVTVYNEEAMATPANDVDQRGLNPLLSKNVDHRNLISLTGSPGSGGGGGNIGQQMKNPATAIPTHLADQPPPKRPALLPTPSSMPPPWANAAAGGDADFRSNYLQQQGLVPPPPMPPMMPGYYNGPGNDSFNNFNMGNFNAPTTKNGQRDIIETVDMEMSDEEQDNGSMDNGAAAMGNNSHSNNGAGASFMSFPPPGPPPTASMNPWGNNNTMEGNNGLSGAPSNGNNNHLHHHSMGGDEPPWKQNSPSLMGGPPRGAGFFGPGGGGGGGPMFRPPLGGMSNNFRGRGGGGFGGGGFPRGGGGGPMNGGGGMFRGRGGPFRGGNFRGGRGMW